MIVNRVFQSKPPRAAAASTPVGKSRIDGGEEPEGRPVEVSPAPRRHPDKAVVHEACARAGAGMGEPGTIAAYQHLAKAQHEVSDIGRHHGSGRSIRQRNPHERSPGKVTMRPGFGLHI